jgi:hypothetical protein
VEDDEMLDDVPPPQDNDCRLDVVVFPQASQKYETQLLKIIHSTVVHRPDMEEDILYVVVFDFPTMLASLFNCPPVLSKVENLVVNLSDRFAKYEAPNHRFGEINSGFWYDSA